MTYKNIKFSDSQVMRSLEKLALKKGLVTADSSSKESKEMVKKVATPTNNLDADIAVLCEKLRESGFSKYADEVESKFILLKKSEAKLYDVIGETGDDLVKQFHPEGSVEIKGIAGDSIVETIVDQKAKIESILKKKPTGKL